jgi:hypothetical protein
MLSNISITPRKEATQSPKLGLKSRCEISE